MHTYTNTYIHTYIHTVRLECASRSVIIPITASVQDQNYIPTPRHSYTGTAKETGTPAFRDAYAGRSRETGTPRYRHSDDDEIQTEIHQVRETQNLNSARENFEANFKSSVRFALIEENVDDW